MKSRSFYLSAAFISAAGALASAAVSMMPAKVFADNVETVTLSAAETLALFGEEIMFTDPNSVAGSIPYTDTFEFVAVGIVNSCPYLGNRQYVNGEMVAATTADISGSGCLIYRTSYNGWSNNLSSLDEITVSLNTFVSVANVNFFHFNLGFSSNEDWYATNISNNYQAIMNSRGIYTLSNNTEVILPLTFTQGSTYGNMSNAYITTTYIPGTNSALSGFLATNFQMNLTLENAVIVNDISVGQCNRVARPRLGNPSGVNDYTYLYITFPTLSDSWSSGGGDESSDSGDDSGGGGGIIEIPDYSEDIATIIEQLDTIISHDVDHFAQINSQMMGLITRFDGLNSRVDGVNSRLDTGNSQLYGINSRLDGIKAAIDSLGGGTPDSLPDNGLQNVSFDSAAQSALGNLGDMYGDSSYSPESESAKSGGFLYFVRSFITKGRLTGVFAILALLMLIRYTIFEKGM